MQKLRFKNRGGILYFGFGDKFKSSKLKYSIINKNIIIGKFKNGQLNDSLEFIQCDELLITKLLDEVMIDKENTLKYNSILAYRNSCKNYIIPYFKGKAATDVRPIDIKLFQDSLVEKGLGIQSISMARGLLKDVFSLAIIREQVNSNPIKMVNMPKFREQKEKPKPFTLDEIDNILAHCSGDIKNFLGISFFTGMRSGEILGLMHHDIKDKTITIKRSISKGKITTPKTLGSIRTIPMFEKARPFIEAQLRESKSLYLFEHNGGPIQDVSIIRKRRWEKLLKDCEISYRKIYCTRHTFITAMLNSEKYKLLTIAKIVGHSSIKTLVENYAGFIRDEHLMIDCEVDIFEEKRHSLDIAVKKLKL